jgi:hypothetical protein
VFAVHDNVGYRGGAVTIIRGHVGMRVVAALDGICKMSFDKQDNGSEYPQYRINGLSWRRDRFGGYYAKVNDQAWMVRMNNFPDEPLYTLIINGQEIIHFNDWPCEWIR